MLAVCAASLTASTGQPALGMGGICPASHLSSWLNAAVAASAATRQPYRACGGSNICGTYVPAAASTLGLNRSPYGSLSLLWRPTQLHARILGYQKPTPNHLQLNNEQVTEYDCLLLEHVLGQRPLDSAKVSCHSGL